MFIKIVKMIAITIILMMILSYLAKIFATLFGDIGGIGTLVSLCFVIVFWIKGYKSIFNKTVSRKEVENINTKIRKNLRIEILKYAKKYDEFTEREMMNDLKFNQNEKDFWCQDLRINKSLIHITGKIKDTNIGKENICIISDEGESRLLEYQSSISTKHREWLGIVIASVLAVFSIMLTIISIFIQKKGDFAVEDIKKNIESIVVNKVVDKKENNNNNLSFDIDLSLLDYDLPVYTKICIPDARYNCSADGCQQDKPSVFALYDENINRVYRCDKKPCDGFDVSKNVSGLYINLTPIILNGSFIKLSDNLGLASLPDNEYIETVSLGLDSIIYRGKCVDKK